MKFGVGVDYCLKAMIVLAERYPNPQPLRVEEIAAAQSIPENYLRRLLIELKRGGLVARQKGPSGGACAMRTVLCEGRDSVKAILRRTTLQALTERRKSAIHFQI